MATPKEPLETPVPFPPTPKHPEVGEPGPSKSVGSYYDVKNSIYFREMARKKTTRKLPKNEPKNTSGGGKSPRKEIESTPLRKMGMSTAGVKNEVCNTTAAGTKASCRNTGGTGGVKKPMRYKPGTVALREI